MNNLISYLVANTYSAFSPSLSAVASVCRLNGQIVACPQLSGFFILGFPLVLLVILALLVASMWKVFEKAGKQGWTSIIPVYNLVIMLEIIKKPTWWVIFSFIPFVNIIVGLIVLYELSKVFGKGLGFMLGLIFLPFIFYPILAFGKSMYIAPAQI